MSKTEIPDTAIERNRAWIAAITNSLGTRGGSEPLRETMRDTGKKYAEQLHRCILKGPARGKTKLEGGWDEKDHSLD